MLKKKKPKFGILAILFAALFVLGMTFSPDTIIGTKNNTPLTSNNDSILNEGKKPENEAKDNQSKPEGNMTGETTADDVTNGNSLCKVHFIDVGQGDSILIEADEHYMLIDAGENNQGTTVVNYLKEQGVKKLDYVIGTHPHSDHIGGLDTVIHSFDIGKVILPDVIHTTKTFEDVLDAIAENGLKITKAVVGNTYSLGASSFTIVAPNASDYDELNDYSVSIKFTNGENSFLFTGDADKLSETQMLSNGIDLSADVLKLGHHGSSTSSHDKFLDEVVPDYAVISVGADNPYGHPHRETLQNLKNRNIKVFRTDKQNTIIFTSNGENITVNKEPYTITQSDLKNSTTGSSGDKEEDSRSSSKERSSSKGRSSSKEDSSNLYTSSNTNKSSTSGKNNPDKSNSRNIIVHITNGGSKYHVAGCPHLKSDIEVTLDEALAKGLEPCGTCNPPTK